VLLLQMLGVISIFFILIYVPYKKKFDGIGLLILSYSNNHLVPPHVEVTPACPGTEPKLAHYYSTTLAKPENMLQGL
jgi:hypothetical protein